MMERWRAARRTPPKKRDPEERRLLATFKDVPAAALFARVAALNVLAPQHLPAGRSEIRIDGEGPTIKEWQALIDLAGLTADRAAVMTGPVDVRARPLYVLPDGWLFLVDITHTLDILWERFEEAARADQAFYDRRYQRAKADWLEGQTASYLKRIFPEALVYSGLTYPDPDRAAGATAELDLAVSWGPFLVLAEAKAKQFRLQSQFGDVPRLRTDLQRNIEDAFEQAQRAARYIAAADRPVLTEAKTGRTLAVDKAGLQRTFLLTVSQHEFARLATGLTALRELNLFRDGEYPLAISAADLDIVSQFCEGPDVFLHYIERRLDVQKNQPNVQADELDFFGAYLDTRLHPQRLWGRTEQKYDRFDMSGWSDQFDRWMMYRRGDLPDAPPIRLDVPPEITRLLAGLRRLSDDHSRWIAFALLDMTDEALTALAEMSGSLRGAELTPGMFRRAVEQVGDVVVLVVASRNDTLPLLHQRVEMRLRMEMYRLKATRGIGFGIGVEQPARPFEMAAWAEGDWQHDPLVEELLAHDATVGPAPGSRWPGPNRPCVCGSGRKFKKCCRRAWEESLRARR